MGARAIATMDGMHNEHSSVLVGRVCIMDADPMEHAGMTIDVQALTTICD